MWFSEYYMLCSTPNKYDCRECMVIGVGLLKHTLEGDAGEKLRANYSTAALVTVFKGLT